jgi:hypothetical protein
MQNRVDALPFTLCHLSQYGSGEHKNRMDNLRNKITLTKSNRAVRKAAFIDRRLVLP